MTSSVADRAPLAVVGMSCRLAGGVDSLDGFWRLLVDGRDAVGEAPPHRSALLNATQIPRAAFLDDVEGFDAEFFGIAPREAQCVDPQHRLILENAWQALEHAGIGPLSLRGTDTGVFVAITSFEYGLQLMADNATAQPWAVNGGMLFGAANRLSYVLDLRGPSMAVDTACAGSLTALHLACESLRRGEVPLAIVGGVNVVAGLGMTAALDAAGAIAPDGRCKSFDVAADGYGRGEGVAVVVVKRLEDALRDRDRVWAVIRGSGVFQDGRSEGIMAPNAEAQEHMLREIYRRAGLAPSHVDYVEAHGTGTPVGDQAEAMALGRVFGGGRRTGRPCLIGSVKPNIGHLEAGCGLAAVIKTVLALNCDRIPPTLYDRLQPDIAWHELNLRVVDDVQAWPPHGSRIAGVSNYGVGGSLAHVILQRQPSTDAARPLADGGEPLVFPVSARCDAGVRALAGRLAGWLREHTDTPLRSVAYTLTRRRSHLSHRAAPVAASGKELIEQLEGLFTGSPDAASAGAVSETAAADAVWVFSGHGAQWTGMCQELVRQDETFRAELDRFAGVCRTELGITPHQAIEAGDWSSTVLVQAMTPVIQLCLAQAWQARGLRPGAVIGYSVGSIAAAVVAGVLDPEEAIGFACRRATLIGRVVGSGAMAMVDRPFHEVQRELHGRSDIAAAIAAAPSWTVVSGTREAIASATAQWGLNHIVRRVATDVAFHSPQMQPLKSLVGQAASAMAPRLPRIPLYSTVVDDPRSPVSRDAAYWVRNLREPVRFEHAVRAAAEDGHRVFLEVSTHPVVTHLIDDILEHVGGGGATAHTLRRNQPEMTAMANTVAALHNMGIRVDWRCWYPDGTADLADLPTMAWQHRPYWLPDGTRRTQSARRHDPSAHTLLGEPITAADTGLPIVWQTHLDHASRPYPGSHPVHGMEIMPVAVTIATFMEAAAAAGGSPVTLRDLRLDVPLPTSPREIQVGARDLAVWLASRSSDEAGPETGQAPWVTHATARVEPGAGAPEPAVPLPLRQLRQRCHRQWEWADLDARYQASGLGGYGFTWRVNQLRGTEDDGELIAHVTIEPARARPGRWAPVLDAATTVIQPLVAKGSALSLITGIDEVALFGDPPAATVLVHAGRRDNGTGEVDITIADGHGRPVGLLRGVHTAAADGEPRPGIAARQLVHTMRWQPLPRNEQAPSPPDLVVFIGEHDAWLQALMDALTAAGVRCRHAHAVPDIPQPVNPRMAIIVAPTPRLEPDPAERAEHNAWTLIRAAQHLLATTTRDADNPACGR